MYIFQTNRGNVIPKKQIPVASSLEELPKSNEDVHAGMNIVAAKAVAKLLEHEVPRPMN